jgi:hypothetical protein
MIIRPRTRFSPDNTRPGVGPGGNWHRRRSTYLGRFPPKVAEAVNIVIKSDATPLFGPQIGPNLIQTYARFQCKCSDNGSRPPLLQEQFCHKDSC